MGDLLGNLWFAAACVGAIGWLCVIGHVLDWWTLPKKN